MSKTALNDTMGQNWVRRCGRYLKPYLLFAMLAPLFMVGEVLMDLQQPKMMGEIVDEGVLGLSNGGVGDVSFVISMGIKMIIIVLIGGTCGMLSGVFANMCAQRFSNDLRKDCYKSIMALSFEQTDKFSTGSLITRVTNDITQLQNLVAQLIRGMIRTLMMFCGGIYYMIGLNMSFGVVIACALPFLLAMVILFIRKANPIFGILQKKLDRTNSVMQENVSGARVVKAYVREEYEKKRFGDANDDLVGTQLKVLKLFSLLMPIINIIMNVSTIAVIYIGSIRVNAGDVTPGEVMSAITYVTQVLGSVMMVAMLFQTISRGAASGKRICEVLECTPTIRSGSFEGKTEVKGEIEFKNVAFSYPGSGGSVLNHINLKVKSGETLAILGATGSGKTTIVNLIPRFYDVTEGEVLVDGVNVKEYKLEALRSKIAIALQKSELFSTTIKENILWGNENASDEEVRRAAECAQAESFINNSTEGYDTMVAEKGMSLSGGQKQRIAIARAVLKDAEILIFDDSTSALDLKTESALNSALRANHGNVTKIIIAQRIASVKDADRIAVIEDGTISSCADHETLMKTSASYRDIYLSQLKSGGEIS